ncbi:MAG: hypothetical protein ACK4Z4_13505, partial [Ferrovibrio sp.]
MPAALQAGDDLLRLLLPAVVADDDGGAQRGKARCCRLANTAAATGDERNLALKQEALLEGMNLDDEGPSGSMPSESRASQLDEATFAKQL